VELYLNVRVYLYGIVLNYMMKYRDDFTVSSAVDALGFK
jgi:hypothetical protein